MKNDTKSQVHQNTLQANAHDVKLRNEMQSAPNDNDNMAMKDYFLEELGRKLLSSWITNQISQLQPCQSYQPTANKLSLRKNYFSSRVINEWNNLPAIKVNAKSVIEFEKLYEDFCGNVKYNYEYA